MIVPVVSNNSGSIQAKLKSDQQGSRNAVARIFPLTGEMFDPTLAFYYSNV
jgi:hypothetical protein